MNELWMTEAQARELAHHAQSGSPNEVCGLLIGQHSRVEQIVPIRNIAQNPPTHYEIDPKVFVKTMIRIDSEGLQLLGIYHSHPKGEPIPSPTDIREAYYPDAAYLIIGLKHQDPALAAWHIENGDVERIPLHIGSRPPDIIAAQKLSQAQVVAIIASAVLAVIVLLVMSIALLPPPPPITPAP